MRPPPGRTSLVRTLTVVPAAAVIMANVIGTGIFLKARVMTCNVGTPGLVLLAYGVGGVFTLAGAMSLSELSTMMPRAGGLYSYLGAAFGRVWAFLFGWMETLIDSGAGTAAVAIGFATFLNDFVGGGLTPSQLVLFASLAIIASVGLTLASVQANGRAATLLTSLKVATVLGVGAIAFFVADGSWGNMGGTGLAGVCEGVSESARGGLTGFGAAVMGALWSFSGWFVVTFVAEEVADPGRTLPRALIGSSILLATAFILVTAGYFFVLGPETVASVPDGTSVAGEVLVRVLGSIGASIMTAGMMVSSFGSAHSTVLTGSRIPFAMSRDGMLPRVISKVSPRTHAPTTAPILMGVIGIAFVMSGTFDMITDLIVFAALIFQGLAIYGVYVLRRKLPDADRPYRVWGYPFVPAIYLAGTVYLMINTLIATPGRAVAGIVIIAAGLPVYWWYARSLPPDQTSDWIGGEEGSSR